MAKTLKQTTDASFIKPLVEFAGEEHFLKKLLKSGEEMPVMKAVGFYRADKSKNHSWVSYVVTFQGDKVLTLEVAEQDMRAIAEEASKMAFMAQFVEGEL